MTGNGSKQSCRPLRWTPPFGLFQSKRWVSLWLQLSVLAISSYQVATSWGGIFMVKCLGKRKYRQSGWPEWSYSQSICSSVSGTGIPRAWLTKVMASSTDKPYRTKTAIVVIPLRPIPARQWTATPWPFSKRLNMSSTIALNAGVRRQLGWPVDDN